MSARNYVNILKLSWYLPAIGILAGTAVASALTFSQRAEYEASSSLFVSTQNSSTVSDLSISTTFTQQVVRSYATVVSSPLVVSPVIRKLGLPYSAEQLAGRIETAVPSGTSILSITVTDPSPIKAAAIANALAQELRTTVPEISPSTSGASAVLATVIQPAEAPVSPASPKISTQLLLGLLTGAVLGIMAAYLRSRLGTRIRTVSDVEQAISAPVIGKTLRLQDYDNLKLPVLQAPRSADSEAFRSLQTNLKYVLATAERRAFVITSSIAGEGKTFTAVNLALSIADAGDSVVLIDADLRRPTVAEYLGIDGALGLSDILTGQLTSGDVMQRFGAKQVDVIPSGALPPNPSELLQSRAFDQLVADMAESHSYVVIDAPPVLPVSDALVIGQLVGSTILVTAMRLATTPQIAATDRAIQQTGGLVRGTVITMLRRRDMETSGYYYGYTSES